MAPQVDAPKYDGGVEKVQADKAKDLMGTVIPPKADKMDDGKKDKKVSADPPDYLDHGATTEAAAKTEGARADIIVLPKQGKLLPASGLPQDLKGILELEDLKALDGPKQKVIDSGEGLALQRLKIPGDKDVFFTIVKDGAKALVYYKVDKNFDPATRTLVSDLDDAAMLALVGANSPAGDSRLLKRESEVKLAKESLASAKEFQVSVKNSTDKEVKKRAEDDVAASQKNYDAAKAAYDKYVQNYVAGGGKKTPNKVV